MASCVSPIWLGTVGLYVPCGSCGACVHRRIQDWINRLKVEHKNSKRSYFLTLTYEETGSDLVKSDIQKFFKRLRKFGNQFVYFALGDYGDTYGRPHFHVILFVKGRFDHEQISLAWHGGRGPKVRGYVDSSALSEGRIAYVVTYGFLAKVDWDKSDRRVRPFFLMSKRPALGASYLTPQMIRFHNEADIWYFPDGKWKKPLPRYWRNKIFKKARILRNAADTAFKQEAARRAEIAGYPDQGRDPELIYDERRFNGASNFLEGLRRKKKMKNKLL